MPTAWAWRHRRWVTAAGFWLDEFACRMVQHEMDHLDGHLFVDRVAPIRRKMIAAKLHNIAKGKARTAYKTKLER